MAEVSSATPPYPKDSPPDYFSLFPKLKPSEFSLPSKDEAKKIVAEAQSLTEQQDVDVNVTVFDTYTGEGGTPFGSLRIGLKRPFGILHHYVGYKAPNPKGLWIDISAGIEVIDDNNKGAYRYVKHETPKDPYSFDITVSNLGLENAHFSGTLTMANGVFAWEGSFVTKVPVKVAVPQLVLPKPPNLEGSIEELRDTLPYAQTNEGDPEKGGLRKGDDAAQRYGDELMSKISVHALDPETKKTLLPQLSELSASERKILDDNPDFFRRFAIHDLSERLKMEKSLSNDIRKHISFKKIYFLKMMSAREKPTIGEDPFEKYWKAERNPTNLAITDKLRDQYLDVTQRCYRAGFLAYCPRLNTYLKQPAYWFRYLEAYLRSDVFCDILSRETIKGHTNKDARDAKVQIFEWGQKLAMLKSVAGVQDQLTLDIDAIMTVLNGYIQFQDVKYQQLINDKMAQHVTGLLKEMDDSPEAHDWKKMFDQRMEGAGETAIHMRTIAGGLLYQISDESSQITDWINRRRAAQLPPGGAMPSATAKPTYYDIFRELDIMNLEKKLEENERMIAAMPLEQVEREYGLVIALSQAAERQAKKDAPKVPWGERIKAGAKKLKENIKETVTNLKFWTNLVKGALHFAATIHMFSNITQNHLSMSVAEMGMIICHLTAFTLQYVGRMLKTGFTWLYTKVNANWAKITTGFVTGWLSNAGLEAGASGWARFGHALVGNLKNTLRAIGLVGMVFSLISCYDEMTKTRDKLEGDDEKKRKIFATVQFVLGVLETLFLVGEIGLEMAGMLAASTLCGVASVVFGALGAIVMVVYIIWFMPSPDEEAKKFLHDYARPLGSYDEKEQFSPEESPGVKLTDDTHKK